MNKSLYIIIFIGVIDLSVSTWMFTHSLEIPYFFQLFISLKIIVTTLIFILIKTQGIESTNHLIVLAFFIFLLVFFYSLPGVIAFTFIMHSYYWGRTKTGKLYHIDQEEGELAGETDVNTKKISIQELTRVAPLIDGLTDDDKNNRIATVLAMEKMVDYPSIRKALMRSQNDPQKEVQYYINDALKKVADDYMDKIKKQLDIINKTEPTYESYKKLADLYAYLANANIDHSVLIRFYYTEMEKYYTYLLENYPENKIEVLRQLVPALYNSKAYDRCLKMCEEIKDIPELYPVSILYKLRSLFSLRKMDAIRELVSSIDLANIVTTDNLLNEPKRT